MVEESVFRGVIGFFDKIGVYDIILPFLLVFTIVFAILEKTKILGLEKIDGKETTKKNLNSMVAFVIAFLGDKEFTLKDYPSWTKFFMVMMFIGIVLIFLHALDLLQYIFALFVYWDAEWASAIIFFIVILGFIWYVIKEPAKAAAPAKKD